MEPLDGFELPPPACKLVVATTPVDNDDDILEAWLDYKYNAGNECEDNDYACVVLHVALMRGDVRRVVDAMDTIALPFERYAQCVLEHMPDANYFVIVASLCGVLLTRFTDVDDKRAQWAYDQVRDECERLHRTRRNDVDMTSRWDVCVMACTLSFSQLQSYESEEFLALPPALSLDAFARILDIHPDSIRSCARYMHCFLVPTWFAVFE